LQIYQWVYQWKNFENRLTFGEVMGKSLVSCFFWDTVYNRFNSHFMCLLALVSRQTKAPVNNGDQWTTVEYMCIKQMPILLLNQNNNGKAPKQQWNALFSVVKNTKWHQRLCWDLTGQQEIGCTCLAKKPAADKTEIQMIQTRKIHHIILPVTDGYLHMWTEKI